MPEQFSTHLFERIFFFMTDWVQPTPEGEIHQ